MANICGISIKAVKHFIGTEGPAYQGNVYIGSKKVAFWSQDGNGGPDWFEMMNGFSKKKLVEAMKPYVDQKSIELKIIDESFMYNLLWLSQSEKEFKKVLKKGYKAMLEVTDGFHVTNYYYPDVPNCTAEALFMRIKLEITEKYHCDFLGYDDGCGLIDIGWEKAYPDYTTMHAFLAEVNQVFS